MTDADRQARKTALTVGAVLVAFGGISLWRHHLIRAELMAAVGSLLLVLGVAVPRWTRPFHAAWMRVARALGYVNSRLILSIMFYGVMTPVGVVMRLMGRDPLSRRRAASDSYWIPRPKTRQDHEQFERLF